MSVSDETLKQNIYDIVIVGGGAGGVAVAASLLKRRPKLAIAIIEPEEIHYYQPGFTLVGAGVFTPDAVWHPMEKILPKKATWIKHAVVEFAPEKNEVILSDGGHVKYHMLVASPGIKLNWAGVKGLNETLARRKRPCIFPVITGVVVACYRI